VKITTNPTDFIPHIVAAASALSARKEEVNKLNVFPVPDGDTGTNMSLTLEAVLGELQSLAADATLADIRKAVTHGSLMGARGNSGVITSQILRGVCDGLADAPAFDTASVSLAMDRAVEVAFNAVRKPVAGTILTVLEDVAAAARSLAESGVEMQAMLVGMKDAAYASVRNTPELLPILKENGVVDAGGFGLALLIDGFVSSITGQASTELEFGIRTESVGRVAIEQINDWEGSDFLYCTEFLLFSEELDIPATQDYLAGMGDCELLVGAHPDFKVHVHTNDPGNVLSYMTVRGQVSEVYIHNMRLQSQERLATLGSGGGAPTGAGTAATAGLGAAGAAGGHDNDAKSKNYGFVAVASGDGIENILCSLGVDKVVSGGQTMNPSTKDLLDAVNALACDKVFIFPNNKNIIMAANAASELAEKQVKVVPTTSVPQCFSALFVADQQDGFEDNFAAMTEAISQVRSGEVTTAIKDAKTGNGQQIHQGDTIGLVEDTIELVGEEVAEVALRLVGLLANDDADTLTILAGADFAEADFECFIEAVNSRYPDLEVDAHRGGQPLYPLVMAAE
jgi:DAK2 domain fusion protein YloV